MGFKKLGPFLYPLNLGQITYFIRFGYRVRVLVFGFQQMDIHFFLQVQFTQKIHFQYPDAFVLLQFL
jgi:hypothetical protein